VVLGRRLCQGADDLQAHAGRDVRAIQEARGRRLLVEGQAVQQRDVLDHLMVPPVSPAHVGLGLDALLFDRLPCLGHLLLGGALLVVAGLALQHGLADVPPDRLLQGVGGLSKDAVALDGAGSDLVLLAQALSGRLPDILSARFLVSVAFVMALLQVVAPAPEGGLFLGRQIAPPELAGNDPVDGLVAGGDLRQRVELIRYAVLGAAVEAVVAVEQDRRAFGSRTADARPGERKLGRCQGWGGRDVTSQNGHVWPPGRLVGWPANWRIS
jgi:hypothetical protein